MRASGAKNDGVLGAPELVKQTWLKHAFGTRHADPDFSPRQWTAVRLKQFHSDLIRVVSAPDAETHLRGDAMITADPGVALMVAAADCLPVLLADPENRVVAAIHAGWRGTLKRITQKTVGAMRAHFGCDPEKIVAAFGPAIQVCCLEVGMEVVDDFRTQFVYSDELFDKLDPVNPALVMLPRQHLTGGHAVMRDLEDRHAFLSLEEANSRQLMDAGVANARIFRSGVCTKCRADLLHSYRREGPGMGQQRSAIGITG